MPSVAYLSGCVLDEHGDPVGEYVLVSPDHRVEGTGWGQPPRWYSVRRVRGCVFPAFVDAHVHPTGLGLALEGVDLRGSRGPGEVAARLARARGPLAYGRGWDQEEFEDPGRLPTRRDLDEAVPDRPAVAVRVCGHVAVANTRALEAARPWEAYPGLVDRETGLLREDAVYHTIERLLESLDVTSLTLRGLEALAGVGVGGAGAMACNASEARALAALEGRGLLPIPVACYPEPRHLDAALAALDGARHAGVVGVKLFADGTLGARTARLREPYSDDPGNRGVLLLDSRAIEEQARRALRAGLRVAVHAIGDEALDHAIKAYERVDPRGEGRVEHASLAHDDQIAALASLGVRVVVQPRFRVGDWWIDKRLGAARLHLAYRLASMASAGVELALSTDAPVEPHEPWETLNAAYSLCSQPSCREAEALTPREAFHAYTRAAAEAAGGPLAGAGRIEKGAPALLALARGDPSRPGWMGPARLLHSPTRSHFNEERRV